MKRNKKILKIKYFVLVMFLLIYNFCFADINSEGFVKTFKMGAKIGNGGIIEKMINALFYGLIILYRGIFFKISQILAFIILIFMIIDVLKIILQNIEKVDLYSIFKMILPNFVKNLLLSFTFVIPVNYKINLGFGNTFENKMITGTMFTKIIETFFSMFYKLGLLAFNDEKFKNITLGKLADNFISKPLNLLQEALKFKTFFAIFINIGKIILLFFCLWYCCKFISKFILIIFETLMFMMFSAFYLVFFILESTKEIAQKGINLIISQIITIFIAVVIMGIFFQLLNLISEGDSLLGIVALFIAFMLSEKTMENIDFLAKIMVK